MQTITVTDQSLQAQLNKAHRYIKHAYRAGLFSGGMTLFYTLAAIESPESAQRTGFSAATLVDVALIFGLTYGIRRNHRMAARFMLAYFALSKLMQVTAGTFKFEGLFLGLPLMGCFCLGVIGTNTLWDLRKRASD